MKCLFTISILLLLSSTACNSNNTKEKLGDTIDTMMVYNIIGGHGLIDSFEFSIISQNAIMSKSYRKFWNKTLHNTDKMEEGIIEKSQIQWKIYSDMLSYYIDRRENNVNNKDDFSVFDYLTDEIYKDMENRNKELDEIFVNIMIERHGTMDFTKFDSIAQDYNTNVIMEGIEKLPSSRHELYGDIMPTQTQVEKDFIEQITYYKFMQWKLYKEKIKMQSE